MLDACYNAKFFFSLFVIMVNFPTFMATGTIIVVQRHNSFQNSNKWVVDSIHIVIESPPSKSFPQMTYEYINCLF